MQARAGAIDELIASGALEDQRRSAARTTSPASSTAMSLAVRRRGRAGPDEGASIAGERPRRIERRPTRPEPAAADRRRQPAEQEGGGMIVRILGEGQWEVADDTSTRSTRSTARVEAAVEAGDEAAFALGAGRAARRRAPRRAARLRGRLAGDSDLILPPVRRDARGGAGPAHRRGARPGLTLDAAHPFRQGPRADRPDDR